MRLMIESLLGDHIVRGRAKGIIGGFMPVQSGFLRRKGTKRVALDGFEWRKPRPMVLPRGWWLYSR